MDDLPDKLRQLSRMSGSEVAAAAADEIERMQAARLMLDRRIHNQRRACRETWEIVEMRQNSIGSKAARASVARYIKRLKAAHAEIERLKSTCACG